MMTQTTRDRMSLLDNFSQRSKDLARSGPQWLRQRRRDALSRFEELGLPSSRLEDWKNTSVRPIAATEFVPAPEDTGRRAAELLSRAGLEDPAACRLVLVNGRFVESLSHTDALPAGVWAGSLAQGLTALPGPVQTHLGRHAEISERAFTALNTAFLDDGALVVVPDGLALETPLQIVHLTVTDGRPVACHPRTLVLAGSNSRLALVETFAGDEGAVYFNNSVTEIFLDANARVEHDRLQDDDRAAFHVGALHSRQSRDSRFVARNFDLGCGLARLDTVAVLDGEGAECLLDGLYLTEGTQHVDNHTTLDHAKPHGQSRELYKGILTDRSRAVFNGRIIVRPDAQKTDAKQSNPNLLLSDAALVHTRPQLEIYADDVKCTHGATIGRLDDNALFYLRSRGLGAGEARNMLIHAFAAELLERIASEPLRARLQREIAARLERTKD